MRRKRNHIPMAEQLAAALSMLLPQALRDEMRRERATAKEVRALFQMDHVVLHAHGGADKWWNLTPMLRELHREKSRGDTSIAAKSKRIAAATAAHRAFMNGEQWTQAQARQFGESAKNRRMKALVDRAASMPKRKIKSRGFDKRHRPMRAK